MVKEKLSFNLSNIHQQEFPFSLKLINYINESADAEEKQKLDRTCKYFFNEAPYLIIDSLEINGYKQRLENEAYDGCIDYIDYNELCRFMEKVNFIWITKKFNVSLQYDFNGSFISKIARCDAYELTISYQHLKYGAFVKLTNSGKVECLDFSTASIVSDEFLTPVVSQLFIPDPDEISTAMEASSTISDSDAFLSTAWDNLSIISDFDNDLTAMEVSSIISDFDETDLEASSMVSDFDDSQIPLEDVLALVPNARIIRMLDCHVTRRTMTKLLSIPWKNKITELSLRKVDGPLDDHLFFKFVKKHFDPDAKICVDFNFENDTFKKLYNQKVLDSDEKMPMFEIAAPLVDNEMLPTPEDEPMNITFNGDDAERQYFVFPYPHMCYIRETADSETWKKFERTCKFFYPKNLYLMVDDVHVAADGKITLMVDNKKMVFENEEEMYKIDKPVWISNSIHIASPFGFFEDRIYAKEISIIDLIIPKKLFMRLTKSGLVKQWDTFTTSIEYDNDRFISLNELLIQLPNVESISAEVRGLNPQNAIKPSSLPQQNKVKYLNLTFIFQPILAHQLYDVLITSLAPKARVRVFLIDMMEEMNVKEFKAQMKAKLDTWKPQIEKPSFQFFS